MTGTNQTVSLDKMVRAYFTLAGVNLTEPGKNVFFNERRGLLFVRATARNLEIIQQAMAAVDQPQPQVTITAKFIEADEAALKGLAFDWTNSPPGLAQIITEAQYLAALAEIEQRSGVDSLTLPKVTSLSDRLIHVGSSWSGRDITLDVLPAVRSDGFSIGTTATLTVTADHQVFRWNIDSFRDVLDGHTLFGMSTNQPIDAGKIWMAFITPRIIDPAGNAVHSDADISTKH